MAFCKSPETKTRRKKNDYVKEKPQGLDDGFNIDKNEEDRLVEQFQKTGDMRILEKVYKQREATLRHWAYKEWYPDLSSTVDDLREELTVIFVKAAHKYDRRRGHFNTCLWTFLLNRLKNIKNSKHAKKRIIDGYEGPLASMILSLDYQYNDKDGSPITLKDIVADTSTHDCCDNAICKMCAEETLDLLADNNMDFKHFLQQLSDGTSFASLIKEYKTKEGKLRLTPSQRATIKGNQKRIAVAHLIRTKSKIDTEFKVIDYDLSPTSLSYTIELKSTPKTDSIIKRMRELRKNKELYLNKIAGE